MVTKLSKRITQLCGFLFLATFTTTAFAQKSVKQIKRSQSAYIPKISERAMVQPLFLQSKKANIHLPNKGNGGISGGNIAVEQTTYVNSDNSSDVFTQKGNVDLSQTFNLQEVTVEVKSTFTPERDGKIDVDFIVKVPKEIIDPNYMINLQPFLITETGEEKLDNVVVKGQQFALKQKLDYQAYDDFLNSIVPKEDYSKVFLDHQGIENDIKARLEFYYAQYHEKWALHKEYEDWMAEQEAAKAEAIAKLKGDIAETKAEFMRRLLAHSAQDLARGVDTTGLAVSYDAAFLNKTKGLRHRLASLIEQEIKIPKKYQEVHAMPITSQGIENIYMTTQDTLDIVKNRYMRDKILENEQKIVRKEEIKKEIIRFPYDKQARLDTTVFTGSDFLFYYKQRVPVLPGMNNVKLCMNTEIVALDESKFNVPYSDTLTYFISSIAQLVDTELMDKETVRNRNVSSRVTINPDYRPGTWRFDATYKNNPAELKKLIEAFQKFNESKTFELDSILLEVSTDLNGDWTKNYQMSENRAKDLAKFLGSYAPMGKQGASFYKPKWVGENWKVLARLIKANNQLSNKDAILDIIANAVNPNESKKEIETKYPQDYNIIKNQIYPELNKVEVVFFANRAGMTSDTEVIKVDPEYKKGIKLLQERKYKEALEILANYPDYNAAVALAALGYNGKAYDVLSKQKSNANVEYLSAVVATRLGQDQVAINHLMKSLKLDPGKLYRVELDPDIVGLVQKYNLTDQLKQAAQ